jgi:putative IMPACT (imprinted ancient) family translation regulator
VSTEPIKKGNTQLVMALAYGATVEQAAKKCGVCERTVYRRLKDPKFQRRVRAARDAMLQQTANLLSAAGSQAVRTLMRLQQTGVKDATQLGAARAVLEIGIKAREIADLAERLEALERRLDQAGAR